MPKTCPTLNDTNEAKQHFVDYNNEQKQQIVKTVTLNYYELADSSVANYDETRSKTDKDSSCVRIVPTIPSYSTLFS